MTQLTELRLGYAAFALALGAFLWACVTALSGCATPAIVEAPTGPGTAYPCGVWGVVCAWQNSCCNQDETCGGEPASVGCPAGMCCAIGEGQPWLESAKPPTRQRPLP